MGSPLVTQQGCAVLLPSCYCADVAYYAAMAAHPVCAVDAAMRFDKRAKHTHRTSIASTHGPMMLTVPVKKPAMTHGAKWTDILVSDHNDWWHLHRTALESAYGRTPFFEYYADELLPALGEHTVNRPITELNYALDAAIRSILGLDTKIVLPEEIDPALTLHDYRRGWPQTEIAAPYYQVREQQLGFIGGMSILDLIFNLGPEAPLYIHKINSQRVSW